MFSRRARYANVIYGSSEEPVFDPKHRAKGRDWPIVGHTMIGLRRLENVQFCVEDVLFNGVRGDLIETGVWRDDLHACHPQGPRGQ